ncbi:hypothetical protein [Photobacterium minamisatsumaniensis]|uniref:hypothetical protein n=1 Tax=Photobacterium minamisatsumaniensis TaxID=2910233 RepID=UPI003D108E12
MPYEKRRINSIDAIIPFITEFLASHTSVPFDMARFANETSTQWGVVHQEHGYLFNMDINANAKMGGQAWNMVGNWTQGNTWPDLYNRDSNGRHYLSIPLPCEMYIIACNDLFIVNFHNAVSNQVNLLGVMGIANVRDGGYWGAIASGPCAARYQNSFFMSVETDGGFSNSSMLAYDCDSNSHVPSGIKLNTQCGFLPMIRYGSRYGYPCLYPDMLHHTLFTQSGTTLFMPCYMVGQGNPYDGELKGELPAVRTLCTKYYGQGDIETYQGKRWIIFTKLDAGGKDPEPRGFAFRVDD